jgi:hypothetical protein
VAARTPRWRSLLPWAVSVGALAYVFGWATDWRALVRATEGANVPLFVAWAVLDKVVFFVGWGALQAEAVRRFVTPVSFRELMAVRGGAELLRAVNPGLADAGVLYGVSQLARGSVAAAIAALVVPVVAHLCVLLGQSTLALCFVEGGLAANRDVAVGVLVGWALVIGVITGQRLGVWVRALDSLRLEPWLHRLDLRTLFPFLAWFALFAAFDLLVQGLSAHAFGLQVDWWSLTARIPLIYVVLALPSFANFGTRELAWAGLFADFGPRDQLLAYALSINTVFLLFHVVVGALFLPRALALVTALRQRAAAGFEAAP